MPAAAALLSTGPPVLPPRRCSPPCRLAAGPHLRAAAPLHAGPPQVLPSATAAARRSCSPSLLRRRGERRGQRGPHESMGWRRCVRQSSRRGGACPGRSPATGLGSQARSGARAQLPRRSSPLGQRGACPHGGASPRGRGRVRRGEEGDRQGKEKKQRVSS